MGAFDPNNFIWAMPPIINWPTGEHFIDLAVGASTHIRRAIHPHATSSSTPCARNIFSKFTPMALRALFDNNSSLSFKKFSLGS